MKHVLFELQGCPFSALDDEEHIKFCLLHAAEASHSQVLKIETHKFEAYGVTGYALLAESHISIHTWPEDGIARCDLFSCNSSTDYKSVIQYMPVSYTHLRAHET